MTTSTIGLLTDFGLKDTYVGQMKCVIKQIAPEADVIDLCHDVAPQNILSGAYLASTAVPQLPAGGVLVGVIDPGVGSNRRAIAVELDSATLVGPDNGLFDLVFENHSPRRIVELQDKEFFREDVSSTFHGRDIFSPIGAHLARGVDLGDLGPEIERDSLERLPPSDPYIDEDRIEAHVIHCDRFGNLILNLSEAEVENWLEGDEPEIHLTGRRVPLFDTFSRASSGEPVAYFGSTGQLEIAINGGNAARYFGADQGTAVRVDRV